jgi:CRISPR type III-B/RAMP module-associated protein Cmr5
VIDRDIAVLARTLVSGQAQTTEQHKEETEYRSLCEGLPILLRTAGLTRTVAFLDAKEGAHRAVLEHLGKQLENSGVYSDTKARKLDLRALVMSKELTMETYCHVSRLAFRIAYWHKRMAQALLKKEGAR